MVLVSLQYKVGATPESGPKFREVSAAGAVLTIEEISGFTGPNSNNQCYSNLKSLRATGNKIPGNQI